VPGSTRCGAARRSAIHFYHLQRAPSNAVETWSQSLKTRTFHPHPPAPSPGQKQRPNRKQPTPHLHPQQIHVPVESRGRQNQSTKNRLTNQNGCPMFRTSVHGPKMTTTLSPPYQQKYCPINKRRVPHISLVFREMWGATVGRPLPGPSNLRRKATPPPQPLLGFKKNTSSNPSEQIEISYCD
jgi:hypothetical protein